jgi:hypothetical protein
MFTGVNLPAFLASRSKKYSYQWSPIEIFNRHAIDDCLFTCSINFLPLTETRESARSTSLLWLKRLKCTTPSTGNARPQVQNPAVGWLEGFVACKIIFKLSSFKPAVYLNN